MDEQQMREALDTIERALENARTNSDDREL
jgi:hypothetical protein